MDALFWFVGLFGLLGTWFSIVGIVTFLVELISAIRSPYGRGGGGMTVGQATLAVVFFLATGAIFYVIMQLGSL